MIYRRCTNIGLFYDYGKSDDGRSYVLVLGVISPKNSMWCDETGMRSR
jgi:hypothetical protein